MPFNKGDFTQQGVAGDVSALVRLNEKRVMKVVLSSDDESDNCDISGAVTDLLNNEVYPIGAGVSGNIEITENGENINVAPYATATVNVSGGNVDLLGLAITFVNASDDAFSLSDIIDSEESYVFIYDGYMYNTAGLPSASLAPGDTLNILLPYTYYLGNYYVSLTLLTGTATDEVNCVFNGEEFTIDDVTEQSSVTITVDTK